MKKKGLAVFVSGGGSNFQAVLDAVAAGRICAEVKICVSSNANAFALERARKHNIPVFVAPLSDYESPERRDEAVLSALAGHEIDYIVLCGYLGVLTPPVFQAYRDKIINVHPALLPKFGGKGMYGLNVHREVLRAGETVTGATVHFADEGIDTGRIIAQRAVAVLPGDTPEALQQRVLTECEHTLLPEVLAALCGEEREAASGLPA